MIGLKTHDNCYEAHKYKFFMCGVNHEIIIKSKMIAKFCTFFISTFLQIKISSRRRQPIANTRKFSSWNNLKRDAYSEAAPHVSRDSIIICLIRMWQIIFEHWRWWVFEHLVCMYICIYIALNLIMTSKFLHHFPTL